MPNHLVMISRAVSFGDGVGGLERAVGDQAAGLALADWRVTLIVASSSGDVPNGVDVRVIAWPTRASAGKPGFGISYALWTRRVRRLLRDELTGNETVYLHGATSGVLDRSLPKAHNVVANPHGMEEFERSGWLREINRVFVRRLARRARLANAIIATDQSLVPQVLKNLRVPESKVAVIPNAIDVSRLDLLATETVMRAPSPDIVTVGRLNFNKGYDLLLEALTLLPKDARGTSLSWTHFGNGPMRDLLEVEAARIPWLDLQVISGASDSTVQSTLQSARAFVQPSRYEGSSLTTLEAMSRSIVCVGTPVGGIPEKLIDGVTGFLAPDVSAEGIRVALERALKADSSIGVRAREHVETNYDLPALMKRLTNVLSQPQRRRIVQVARHIGRGAGVSQVVASLETAFVNLGLDVGRLTLRDTGIRRQTPISSTLSGKFLLLLEVVWFSVAGTYLIRRTRRRDPSTLVLVHGDPIGGHAYVNHGLLKSVMRKRRASRIIWLPTNPMHWFTLARDEIRYRSRIQNRIICLTEDDAAELTALYPKLKSPIDVIPNGVDVTAYGTPDPVSRKKIRKDLGVDENTTVALFVGHEFDRKGLHFAVDAVATLERDVKLLVVGGTQDMVSRFRAANVNASGVHFVGSTSDIGGYYAAADLLVLPTDYETGPLVLLEALAAGLPVVMTPTGLAPSVIQDGQNGYLVERRTSSVRDGLQRCIDLLASDRATVRRSCENAAEPYRWDSIAARYVETLDQAASSA